MPSNTNPEADGANEFGGPELIGQTVPLPPVEIGSGGVEENPAEFDMDGRASTRGRERLDGNCSPDGG